MAETTVQPEYTTVQLRKDLHRSVRFLALNRDTDVKTVIDNAVSQYLAQAGTGTNERPAATVAQ